MNSTDGAKLAIKQSSVVDKYHGEATGDPFEVSTVHGEWTELDGTPITDPDRIARLEAKAQEGY